jgi:hypothetical protein
MNNSRERKNERKKERKTNKETNEQTNKRTNERTKERKKERKKESQKVKAQCIFVMPQTLLPFSLFLVKTFLLFCCVVLSRQF